MRVLNYLFLFTVIIIPLLTMEIYAQPSTANYIFTHAQNGTLTDMSSGTTELIGVGVDDGVSGLANIGFDFYFMATRYNSFSVTTKGVVRLGSPADLNFDNNLNTSSGLPLITPFWDDIGVSSTGEVRYKVTGTAPERVLTVEWFNMRIALFGSTTADGTFQLRLYETTGKIEFVYGSMNIGEGSPTVTASIGFTTGNALNELLSVTSISVPAITNDPLEVNNNLVNSNTPGPIPGLNSQNQGERVIYGFTPPQTPPAPSNLSFTDISAGSMNLNWTPGAGIISQAIYMSTDNVQFNYIASVSSSENSYEAEGLSPSTTYYWRIYSVTEGALSSPLEGSQATIGGSFAGGTKTIGTTGDYTSLQSIFEEINAFGLTGAVTIELLADYNAAVETYPINPGYLIGSSETNTVILRPEAGVTNVIFASGESQTFNLNGSKHFTIDGRPGGIGTEAEITISNTDKSGNSIRFTNGASDNIIKYCKVEGVNNTGPITDGIISISETENSNNITIDNCDISNGVTVPNNLIFVGTGNNNQLIVTNSRLYNFSSGAIKSRSDGGNFIITGNHIYRTIEISGINRGIDLIEGGTGGHLISGNFIGGSDISCGGSYYVSSSSFRGIVARGNNSVIEGNVIQNISANSTTHAIELRNGNFLVSNNLIGSETEANSITVSGTINGISGQFGSVFSSMNNVISNLTQSGTSTSAVLIGIQIGSNPTQIIINNTIKNLTSNSRSTNLIGVVTGILVGDADKISGNSIHTLTSIPGSPGTANTTVIGIRSGGGNIEGNKIFDLNNLSTGTAPNIFGIISTSGSGTISNNQVTLETGALNTNPVNVRGIQVNVSNVENIWDVFYNSVYVAGEVFSGSLVTSAFYKQNTNTVNLRNNLFFNERTGGTGGNFAVAFENNTNVTSDYNLLVSDPTTVGLWGATPYNFADYKTNSGLDGFSYSTDPTTLTTANLFVDAASGNLNINASNDAAYYVDGKGIAIEGISGDFDDSTGVRNTFINEGATDIGSDEFDFTGTVPDLTASGSPAPSTTTMYSFAGRELGSITWGAVGTVPSSISAKYFSGYTPPGTLNDGYGNAYWDINATGGTGYSFDLTLNYTPAVLFNIAEEEEVKMGKRDGGEWNELASTVNTTLKTLTAAGLSSFSEFTLLGGAASSTFQLAVDVENGWNMVSVPGLHPVDQNVDTWWVNRDPGANVFSFNGGYDPVTNAAPGTGYWMKHSGAQTYNTGDEWPAGGITIVPNDPIAGNTGWNLIGGYHYNALTSGITTTPGGAQTGAVFGYTNTTGYTEATELLPGYAYWLKLTQVAQINLPDPTFRPAEKLAGNDEKEKFGKIIITDMAGRTYTLYAGAEKTVLNKYELPPVPFADMFDVRYSSGRYVEQLGASHKEIKMQGVEYPVSIRAEGFALKVMDESGKVINVNLKDGESASINNSSISKLIVTTETIPLEFALEQNYPNPFNPTTTIRFAIPEVTNVKLTIYNILGERVTELINQQMEPGYYNYVWDAGNVASGLYMYEVRTDKNNAVKKMMLLK